jgi:hypothetical protein
LKLPALNVVSACEVVCLTASGLNVDDRERYPAVLHGLVGSGNENELTANGLRSWQ